MPNSDTLQEAHDSDDYHLSYSTWDDPFELQKSLSQSSSGKASSDNPFELSPNAWIPCAGGTWVLEAVRFGKITVTSSAESSNSECKLISPDTSPISTTSTSGYDAQFFPLHFSAKYRYVRSLPIVKGAPTLAIAIAAADTFAKTRIKGLPTFQLLRSAPWRRGPASDAQKALIRRRLGDHLDGFLKRKGVADFDNLTKGQAATIIAALMNGARGAWQKKNRQEERQREKVERSKRRDDEARLKRERVQADKLMVARQRRLKGAVPVFVKGQQQPVQDA